MEDKKEQKKTYNKKNVYKKIVTSVIAVILFVVILLLSLITLASSVKASNLAFLGYKFYIMESTTQPEIALKGDLVIVKKIRNGEVKAGDKIVYGDGKFYYCDNIVETKKVNTVTKMISAKRDGIKYQFSESEVEGKIIRNIKELGNIISFLRTPIGMIFLIIFTVCIFILLRILFIGNPIFKKKDEKCEKDETKSDNT